ncbi:MAG: endonuclease [Micavibrio sp.]|nr:endonuclease [Micavibrio sp.]
MDERFTAGLKDADPLLWPESIEVARGIQEELRHKVLITDDFGDIRTIAGVDVGYDMDRNLGRASIVVVDADDMEPVASAQAYLTPGFPYVPGFLSFREVPVILRALKCLPVIPDLLMVDGQGIAHPRRFGIAAHLGVETGLPSIGVAKSLLTGKYAEPGPGKGAQSILMDRYEEEQIGTVLRSKDKVNPLFISPGHRVGQDSAVRIVMECLRTYRLPEPTRLADKFSKTLKA